MSSKAAPYASASWRCRQAERGAGVSGDAVARGIEPVLSLVEIPDRGRPGLSEGRGWRLLGLLIGIGIALDQRRQRAGEHAARHDEVRAVLLRLLKQFRSHVRSEGHHRQRIVVRLGLADQLKPDRAKLKINKHSRDRSVRPTIIDLLQPITQGVGVARRAARGAQRLGGRADLGRENQILAAIDKHTGHHSIACNGFARFTSMRHQHDHAPGFTHAGLGYWAERASEPILI